MEDRLELKLAIEGMHCGACVRRVEAALARIGGVRVRAVETGAAAVDYDPARVRPREILDVVNAIGFTAREG